MTCFYYKLMFSWYISQLDKDGSRNQRMQAPVLCLVRCRLRRPPRSPGAHFLVSAGWQGMPVLHAWHWLSRPTPWLSSSPLLLVSVQIPLLLRTFPGSQTRREASKAHTPTASTYLLHNPYYSWGHCQWLTLAGRERRWPVQVWFSSSHWEAPGSSVGVGAASVLFRTIAVSAHISWWIT